MPDETVAPDVELTALTPLAPELDMVVTGNDVIFDGVLDPEPPPVPNGVPAELNDSVSIAVDAIGRSTDAPRATWSVLGLRKSKNVVIIADELKEGEARRSVTNDAEYVVATLNALRAGIRIIYRDTQGDYAEIYHKRGVFLGYEPIGDVEAYIKDRL